MYNVKTIMNVKSISAVILLLFASVSISYATTYYVRSDGRDSNNGQSNTSAGAWQTLQKAANIMIAGDTAQIAAGTYSGFTTVNSGSAAGGYITFMRQGTDMVTLASSYPNGQIVINHNYIKIDGFTTTMSDSYSGGATVRVGFSSRVNHITIQNCDLKGNGANTFLVHMNADDVLFDRNIMEGPTFYIGIVQIGQRQIISNNVIKNIADVERVFNVACSNSTWSGNEIYGMSWTGNTSVHPDVWQTINDGSVAQHNIIENNYVHDFNNAQVGNTETAGTNVSDWTWRNNVFANAGTLYIHTPTFKFYNNTYYRTGASGQAAILMYSDSLGDCSGAEFKNNIFVENSGTGHYGISGGSPTYTADYNFVSYTDYTARSGFSETHGVNGGNPQFQAVYTNCTTNTCNFNIGSNSVVIDKGITLPGFSTDKNGISRPQGAAWDIGAYEYPSGSSAVKRPMPPTLL